MPPVLSLTGVSVRRGTSLLLDDVTWTVEEDERWVVLGPNGAGKTTLLQVAGARLFPTRGDVEVLSEQMQRISRLAHRVIWVNPLKAAPGYQPIARGMAAALPYADEFLPGNNLESLEELARDVSRAGAGEAARGVAI